MIKKKLRLKARIRKSKKDINTKLRLKARIRKSKKDINRNVDNFFEWIKGAEIVNLKSCNTDEDPIRPELDNEFRITSGRKVFGLKNTDNGIEGVVCVAFTREIPTTVKELELMSIPEEYSNIAIAYTLWSLKKGAGKKIMKELIKCMKEKEHLESFITLSPLTPMATHFHIRNGARLIKINPTTQNFEYK